MKSVSQMVADLIGIEGGYTDNPHDTGGETIWGITEATARRNGYAGVMKYMPREIAAEIYLNEYFITPGLDRVFPLSAPIAAEMFDTGVNMGVSIPCKFLQRCLNVLNRSHGPAPLYPDLVVDGKLGNKSIDALNQFLLVRKQDGELVLLRMLNVLQGMRYIEITENRVQNEEFLYGWFLNRVVI